MRTLKKSLSLILVVCMILSMGVIGASADFTDVKEGTNYKLEIEVLSKIGVINGMTATTFAPDGDLTRAQAAKIIAYVKLGATNAGLIKSASSQRFSDVPTSHWAAGFIEYGANLGIIQGVGNGEFAPEGKLTVAAFTKMLLVAVGYDAEEDGFVGESWAINVASKAIEAEIIDDNIAISNTNIINRAEACRLAFLALFYGEKVTETKTQYVVLAVAGAAAPNNVGSMYDTYAEANTAASTDTNAGKLLGSNYTISAIVVTEKVSKDSLANTIFKLKEVTAGSADSFGRPSTKYVQKNKTLASRVDTPILTYTKGISGDTLYKDLGLSAALNITATISSDAAQATATFAAAKNGASFSQTGYGVLTEVYETGEDTYAAVVIAPKFGEVTVSSRNQTSTVGAYTQYTIGALTGKVFSTVVDADDDVDTAIIDGTVANSDMVLYYQDKNGDLYIEAVETVTGKLTYVGANGTLTLSGSTRYQAKASTGLVYDSAEKDYYVDSYGNIIEPVTSTSSTQYAYVVETYTYMKESGRGWVNAQGAVLAFADGTMAAVEVAAAATAKKVVTYTVKSGVYTLTNAGATSYNDAVTKITKNSSTLTGGSDVTRTNSSTVFVFINYDADDAATLTPTLYTGYAGVPTTNGNATNKEIIAVSTNNSAVAKVVFIDKESISSSHNYIFVKNYAGRSSDGYVYNVIIGGNDQQITLSTQSIGSGDVYTLYSSLVDDGTAVTATAAAVAGNSFRYSDGLVYLSNVLNANIIAADAPVYIISANGKSCTTNNASAFTSAIAGAIYMDIDTADSEVKAVYVREAAVAPTTTTTGVLTLGAAPAASVFDIAGIAGGFSLQDSVGTTNYLVLTTTSYTGVANLAALVALTTGTVNVTYYTQGGVNYVTAVTVA